jgi:HEAT repeat protein
MAPIFRTAVALLMAGLLSHASSAEPLLATQFDAKGLSRVSHLGVELLVRQGGEFKLNQMTFRDAQGKTRTLQGNELTAGETRQWDATQHRLTLTYPWGSASCTYQQADNRLRLTLDVTNASAEALVTFNATLFKLAVPKSSSYDRVINATSGDWGSMMMSSASGVLAICNEEQDRPFNISPVHDGTGYQFQAGIPKEMHPVHPVIDSRNFMSPGREIPPGKSDSFRLTLVFDVPGTPWAKLCQDVIASRTHARPLTLKWPDRRPIGTEFLCSSFLGWATNPRGYLFGKGQQNDVTTEEGIKAFGEGLFARADQDIAILRGMNAQGIIIWDLEGQEFWHPLSYIGDPRMLPAVSPEMNRFADALFTRFRDAGLKVGVTIRPTEVYARPGENPRFWHRYVADPVKLLDEKITYAQQRWGCTIFYLDSNVQGDDWDVKRTDQRVPFVLPMSILEEVHRRHPDVLIIPEWGLDDYYRICMPYRSPNLRQVGTSSIIHDTYPQAGSAIAIRADLVEERWDEHVNDLVHNSLLLVPAWYPCGENRVTPLLYREAGYLRAGMPAAVANATGADLRALAGSKEPIVRYFTSQKLAVPGNTAAIPCLKRLLDDPDPIVRKSALVALEKIGIRDDQELMHRLLAWIRIMDTMQPDAYFRPFAADALGNFDEQVVPSMVTILNGDETRQFSYAMRVLGQTRTQDHRAQEAVLAMLKAQNPQFREQAAQALGKTQAKGAVDALIQALDDKDESVAQAAVEALGLIGDKRAIEPLVKLLQRRNFQTFVVYSIPAVLDAALQRLTGEKLEGVNAWTQWWDAR